MSLDDRALRLASSPFRVSEFLRKESGRIAQEIFKQTIINLGSSLGMTNRVLSKLSVKSDGITINITLPYHGPTRGQQAKLKWFVKPDSKKALHWGEEFFSKGHFVTGIDGLYVVNTGIQQGLAQFRRAIKSETESHLEANRIG